MVCIKVSAFVLGYIEAAFFTSTDSKDRPLDSEYSVSNLSKASRRTIEAECNEFIGKAGELLEEAMERGRDEEHLGHDYWLTRNGHGTGFWDRPELEGGDLGKKLSDLSQGERYLEVSRRGLVRYF